ncbi:MAG: hypothetical protein PBV01_10370 [Brucella anthropi]|jgi:hypothetical protein
MSVLFQARVLKGRETPEAIQISHPKKPLKVLFLPKSEIRDISPIEGKKGFFDIEIPDWLAEKHDL